MSAASEPPAEPVDEVALGNRVRLEPFVELFDRYDVEYVVIGGQAEGLMGGSRPTLDTDFCYRRSPDNLERVAAALNELKPSLRGAPPDLPFVIDAHSLALGSNFIFSTPYGAFDLLGWVEPVGDYDALAKGSEETAVGTRSVRTIGLDDLIRVKEHIRRDKDQASLRQLYLIRQRRSAAHEA